MLFLLACATEEPAPDTEPLTLPDDPAEDGVPVGVTTVIDGEQTYEVWYPASDSTTGATEEPDFDQFLPAEFLDHVGDVSFPTFDSGAVRDAPLRLPEEPYPVVLFSHGFGGMRLQSIDFTRHLASRGYVVVAPDHPGRTMGDVLPCLFSPPLDGCDLSGMTGEDPAEEDLADALAWVDAASTDGFFAGALDTDRLGLAGHSAGAGSTITVGSEESRFDALLPMAGFAAPSRDVPTMMMGGTCDSFATDANAQAAFEDLQDGWLVRIQGAGHLAFSDLCALDLAGNAGTWLAGRDDLNDTMYELLLQLATDGCPDVATPSPKLCDAETFLPLETSAPIVRSLSTQLFDATLRGEGSPDASAYADAELRSAE